MSTTLSPRQREIIRLMANGCEPKEIAEKCQIKERTARFHIYAIIKRLKARNTEHAVYVFFCR